MGGGILEPELMTQLDSLRPHLARAAFLSARLALERLCTLTSALETVGLPTAVWSRREIACRQRASREISAANPKGTGMVRSRSRHRQQMLCS